MSSRGQRRRRVQAARAAQVSGPVPTSPDPKISAPAAQSAKPQPSRYQILEIRARGLWIITDHAGFFLASAHSLAQARTTIATLTRKEIHQ